MPIPPTVVAIPAHDEAERVAACLASLMTQRDAYGAPLPDAAFSVVVYANNCADDTASIARDFARDAPHPITVVEGSLPPGHAHAGWARRHAMDLAAEALEREAGGGHILTTDADTQVAPDWIAATHAAFARGVDAVAGFHDGDPSDTMRLSPTFVRRARAEGTYARLMAEVLARGDPRPHDPWPNHRVSSGATLAVSLEAYRAIGGLPPAPHAEDVMLSIALEEAGFRIRHALDVRVTTSWRLDGRAATGTAAVMRERQVDLDGFCEDDQEPAIAAVRRATWKGRLRRAHARGLPDAAWLARRLGLEEAALVEGRAETFPALWSRVCATSPRLAAQPRLRPSDLPRERVGAERALRLMRRRAP